MSISPDLDVEYIANNPEYGAYITPQAFIVNPYTKNLELIGEAPVYEEPNKQVGAVFHLRNDEGSLFLDLSILSNKSIQRVANDNNFRQNLSEILHMLNANGFMLSEEEYNELKENVETYVVDKIEKEYNYSTEFLLNQLYGIKNEVEDTSKLVDNMLSDIFGDKVTIKNDEAFFENTDGDYDKGLIETNNESDNDEYLKEDPIEEDTHKTFEEIINDISKNSGYEIENIEKEEDDDNPFKDIIGGALQPADLVSKKLDTLFEISMINSAKTCLEKEPELDFVLSEIMNINIERLDAIEPLTLDFIKNICYEFYNNKDLGYYSLSFYDEMKREINFIKTENFKPFDSNNFEKYLRIKNSLFEDFNRHYYYLDMIRNDIARNEDQIEDKQLLTFFCLIFQITNLINKNRLKNENDINKRNEFLNKNPGINIENVLPYEYEKNIFEFGMEYMNEFRNMLNKLWG